MEKHRSDLGIISSILAVGIMFGMVLLPSMGKSIAIIFFAIIVILLSIKKPFYVDKRFLFLNSILFLSLAFTLLYTENTEYGLRKLGTMASLLIFPVFFSMMRKEHRNGVFNCHKVFILIYVLAVFLFNLLAFLWFYYSNYSFDGMIEHFTTVVRVDMGKFSIHPIYLSMHCAVAILFSLYLFKENKKKGLIFLLIVIDILLVSFLLLYAKKGPLIALILVFLLYVVFQRGRGKVTPYLIAVFVVVGLTIAIPKTRNNFVELLKIENVNQGEVTSTNIRYTIYKNAQELISQSAWLGYGIGDYNDALIKSYETNDQKKLIDGSYNSHNQYFSLFLIGGIFVFIIFVITLFINLVYAIRYDNQLLILLLVFYGIVMLTENILEREQGVIYFSLFLNYFSLRSKHLATYADSTDT